ncbi:MAG: hypothetical protein JST54_18290 [Deltaproteobacteria bacterium]|nr:hypothetical protein [Deltaproteobacteria bacterium]
MLPLALAATILAASPTRLAQCDSGKTGHVQLFIAADGKGGYILSSKDDADGASARVFSGTVRSATHHKLDKKHHAYRFVVEGGQLQQAAGLDDAHCKAEGESARCAFDVIEIKLMKGGPKEPGDDGLTPLLGDAAIGMDNGSPQNCTVFASKALSTLLKARK